MSRQKRLVSCGRVIKCVKGGSFREENTNPVVQSIKKLHFAVLWMIPITHLRKKQCELE